MCAKAVTNTVHTERNLCSENRSACRENLEKNRIIVALLSLHPFQKRQGYKQNIHKRVAHPIEWSDKRV